jgi:hypothetical protein
MQSSSPPFAAKGALRVGPKVQLRNQLRTSSRNRVVLAASELEVACRKSGARQVVRQARASVAKQENEFSSTSALCAEKRRSA